MVRINIQKVLVGGMIAGVVLSVIDVFLYGGVLKAPMEVAWHAAGRPAMSDALRSIEVPASIFLDFVAGVFLVWLYAAIRPRFGAGPGTAVRAGLAGWFLAGLLSTTFMAQGIMPRNVMIITTLVLLVEYPLAVVIGARFYTEGAAIGAT